MARDKMTIFSLPRNILDFYLKILYKLPSGRNRQGSGRIIVRRRDTSILACSQGKFQAGT